MKRFDKRVCTRGSRLSAGNDMAATAASFPDPDAGEPLQSGKRRYFIDLNSGPESEYSLVRGRPKISRVDHARQFEATPHICAPVECISRGSYSP